MADASGASPSRFLPHRTGATPPAATQVAVIAAIDKAWKRRRDVASPPARLAAGGATAPTVVAVNTPPARRQRTVAFNLTGADIDAKLESFKAQVIEEFLRVHNSVDELQASSLDAVSSDVFDSNNERVDQQFLRSDALMAGIAANAQQIADGFAAAEVAEVDMRHRFNDLVNKLKTLEDELHRWTSVSAEHVSTLAGMQEVADATYARSMVEASEGDERMKAIIETQLATMQRELASLRMAAPHRLGDHVHDATVRGEDCEGCAVPVRR